MWLLSNLNNVTLFMLLVGSFRDIYFKGKYLFLNCYIVPTTYLLHYEIKISKKNLTKDIRYLSLCFVINDRKYILIWKLTKLYWNLETYIYLSFTYVIVAMLCESNHWNNKCVCNVYNVYYVLIVLCNIVVSFWKNIQIIYYF